MKKQRVAVRTLVETILLSGSLLPGASYQRMLEGVQGHRALQAVPAENARNEVTVSGTARSKNIELTVYGRIDRLYGNERIEEIKTTHSPGERLRGGGAQHWAQAKCYAYLYCAANGLTQLEVSLTYFHLGTGELTTFTQTAAMEELRELFESLSGQYLALLEAKEAHAQALCQDIRALTFPYEAFRPGQHTLASQVYHAISKKTALLAQAPTGTGKTMAVLFPALKALGEGHGEKLFYLTARTTQQEAAVNAVRLAGLPHLRTVVISAKEKMCVYDHPICREGECPLAQGYYDRLNSALEQACRRDGLWGPEDIRSLAAQHFLCPFELSLDLTNLSDLLIGDYNYAFDPRVRLQRFFSQKRSPFVLLIDEAHNLPDRGRGMYTAELSLRDVTELKRSIPRGERRSPLYRSLTALVGAASQCFSALTPPCAQPDAPVQLAQPVQDVMDCLSLENVQGDAAKGRQLFFALSSFVYVLSQYDENYLTLYQGGKTVRRVTLFCADPSQKLAEAYKKSCSQILFSATLTPAHFYRNLCGLPQDAALLALPSPFPPENLAVFHLPVDTRYRMRQSTMEAVAEGICAFVQGRDDGNYLIFLPSHGYLASVEALIRARLPEATLLSQQPVMDDPARADFLNGFQAEPKGITLGLAVMGGVFAEGIDLPGSRLCGAAIVGVGLPQLCLERDVLKNAYEAKYADGYRYAYQYPGMCKVLQAAGRIIRRETDRGALLLIDRRYLSAEYRELLPQQWRLVRVNGAGELKRRVNAFWGEAPSGS